MFIIRWIILETDLCDSFEPVYFGDFRAKTGGCYENQQIESLFECLREMGIGCICFDLKLD